MLIRWSHSRVPKQKQNNILAKACTKRTFMLVINTSSKKEKCKFAGHPSAYPSPSENVVCDLVNVLCLCSVCATMLA